MATARQSSGWLGSRSSWTLGLLVGAALSLLLLAPQGSQALRCYASIQSTRGEFQVVRNYQCEDAAAACGVYRRPCNNTTSAGCTNQEVLGQQNTTVYSCFYSLQACGAVAQLQNYSLLSCCASANCNAPDNSASSSAARLSLGTVLVAALLSIVLVLM